ncbi:hypothetical protein [Flavobacterium aquatile]|uniref:hypothetical protein n=1 Tax=Flavobacterium aquatile TaxID=245 RepID=UPI000AC9605C|nr:hypothetical protein [Flavobacterium aquatile]
MKKWIFLISIIFAFNSCTVGDEPDRSFFLLPVDQVEMPSSYILGNISKIKVKYRRPTDCYIFNGFNVAYDAQNHLSRTVAIQAVRLNNSNCLPDTESLFEIELDFKPTVAGVYTFKFWLGADANGVDQYETHEVEIL